MGLGPESGTATGRRSLIARRLSFRQILITVHDTVHSRLVHSRSSSPTGRSIHCVSVYRALKHTDDNVDLCDLLSSFSYGAKVKLHELSRIMGLPGKPDGMDGSQVEACESKRSPIIANPT
jgi:Predicted 3'-5' exonuclease related to the exonuclease domain of PolB